MELILQPSLPHQQKAVDAIADVFHKTTIEPPSVYYANPQITTYIDGVGANIKNIQDANGLSVEYKGYSYDSKCLNLDIKMETGTGKTYVYTHAMYELHKRYCINKFIVAVPTLPIKAGARQFMGDYAVKRHFRDVCGYEAEIELLTLEPAKNKKKGRQYFPTAVSEFVKGSSRNSNKIYLYAAPHATGPSGFAIVSQLLKDSLVEACAIPQTETLAAGILFAKAEVLSEEKPNQKEQIKFKTEDICKYFPKSYTSLDMQKTIITLLEKWQRQRERNRGEAR